VKKYFFFFCSLALSSIYYDSIFRCCPLWFQFKPNALFRYYSYCKNERNIQHERRTSKQLLPLIIHVSSVYVITPKRDQEGMADNLSHEYQLENSMIGERKVITKNKLEFCWLVLNTSVINKKRYTTIKRLVCWILAIAVFLEKSKCFSEFYFL